MKNIIAILATFIVIVASNSGTILAQEIDPLKWLAGLSFFALILLLLVYFVPTIIGFARGHHNRVAILVLNLFLGWTFLGWIVALIWSFTETRRPGTTP